MLKHAPIICRQLVCIAALGALALAPHAHATSFDSLLRHVPSSADGVVAADHRALIKHPSGPAIMDMVFEQGAGVGIRTVVVRDGRGARSLHRSVSFRYQGTDFDLIEGPVDSARLKRASEEAIKTAFREGETAGKRWVTLSRRHVMLQVTPKVVLVGPLEGIKALATTSTTKAKSLLKRKGLKAVHREAKRKGALIWGYSGLPASARRHLHAEGQAEAASVESAWFFISGTKSVNLESIIATRSAAEALRLKARIEAEVSERIEGSMVLRALGYAALARRITFSTNNAQVRSALNLTAPEVKAVANSASKALSVLRTGRGGR